jgi:hypothetical protein
MKGILKALSIQSYGLFEKKDKKPFFTFTVLNSKLRAKSIDILQGTEVDYNKDIKPLLQEWKK